jgi:hypothetical protein
MGRAEAAHRMGVPRGMAAAAGHAMGRLRDAGVESAQTGRATGGPNDRREQLLWTRHVPQVGASIMGRNARGEVWRAAS